jgi:hypothetical protein
LVVFERNDEAGGKRSSKTSDRGIATSKRKSYESVAGTDNIGPGLQSDPKKTDEKRGGEFFKGGGGHREKLKS